MPSNALGANRVELVVHPTLIEGYRAQGPIKNWTRDDIDRLDIIPYVKVEETFKPISATSGEPLDGGEAGMVIASMTGPSIDFNQSVRFGQLGAKRTYRVVARAYDQRGELISIANVQENVNAVEITVGTNDTPTVHAKLPVRLKDVDFAGRTTVSLGLAGAINRAERLMATLYTVSDGFQVPIANTWLLLEGGNLPKAGQPRVMNLGNLQAKTQYRVIASVLDSTGTIATDSVDVSVGTDDTPADGRLVVTVPEHALRGRLGQ